MSQKSSNMSLFRLAKKAKGLALSEGRALLAITDTCSMADGVCRKSVETLCHEYKFASSTFHYGVNGRKRKNGTDYFPGLIRRGLVTVLSGGTPKDGVPTVYRVNEEMLRAYCGKTSPQTSPQIMANLSTNEGEPLHNQAKTSSQWETSSLRSSKESSKDLVLEVRNGPNQPVASLCSPSAQTKGAGKMIHNQSMSYCEKCGDPPHPGAPCPSWVRA